MGAFLTGGMHGLALALTLAVALLPRDGGVTSAARGDRDALGPRRRAPARATGCSGRCSPRPGVALGLLDLVLAARPDRVLAARHARGVRGHAGPQRHALGSARLAAASARRAWGSRALLVVAAALAVGAQRYFFARYHAYMNPRAVLVGTSMLPSVGQQLWVDRARLLLRARAAHRARRSSGLASSSGWPPSRQRARGWPSTWRPSRCSRPSSCVDAPGSGGEQAGAPDVLYLASMGRLASARWHARRSGRARAPRAAHIPCPSPAIATRGPRRSVLFIVTESVRATDACSVPTTDCATTPFTNALLPAPLRLLADARARLDDRRLARGAVERPAAHRVAPGAARGAAALGVRARRRASTPRTGRRRTCSSPTPGTWLEGLPLSHWVSAHRPRSRRDLRDRRRRRRSSSTSCCATCRR